MEKFILYLKKQNLSTNTINTYVYGVEYFINNYKINSHNLLAYKGYLLETFKPKTVNLRIHSINKYLDFINKKELKIHSIKIQNKTYLENVISNADYVFLKKSLKRMKNYKWYFVVWFLAATGARVSELIKVKVEHIKLEYFDIYSKGGKLRRLYLPKKLTDAINVWLKQEGKKSGYIFTNKLSQPISTRAISQQLKKIARKLGIDQNVVYPHSFRHLFAKNFLERFNDISLLADLMGHESIETTRIYLGRSSSEQKQIVDDVIDW
ncbi:tyrosine-type recombinase/integrase [Mycoplasma mycoides]|uniref:tyrosine-type recombinase/integrase n=1 Tax=Mycoplasma mycoides TaxID=2102 RepID=UPI00034D6B61|nr:tyrosine-type recombinase/integrase [Mycoplasma mycoides]EXU60008.1 Integrase-recombinase [Mycoplasma mycoides subsp. capri PG3]QVK04698.1 tyrosine-type recombinase/integrase [Mycoplasma mycoides subsp. capri]